MTKAKRRSGRETAGSGPSNEKPSYAFIAILNLLAQAACDPGVTGAQLRVFIVLARYSDAHGYCFPSISTLAKQLRVTRQTVQGHLRALECAGYLSSQRRFEKETGRERSKSFFLNLKRGSDPPQDPETAPPPGSETCTGEQVSEPAQNNHMNKPNEPIGRDCAQEVLPAFTKRGGTQWDGQQQSEARRQDWEQKKINQAQGRIDQNLRAHPEWPKLRDALSGASWTKAHDEALKAERRSEGSGHFVIIEAARRAKAKPEEDK